MEAHAIPLLFLQGGMEKKVSLGKILVIDDDYVAREVLANTLAEHYEVLCAAAGWDGLELGKTCAPDLILLDIMMPELDGYTVCRRLKEDPITREIPVIFITALDNEEDEARGLRLGAVDYIAKPIRPAIVLARIKTHIRLKQQNDHLARLVHTRTVELLETRETVMAQYALVRELFETMDEMLANRDHYTYLHALRVAEISRRVGQVLGLANDELEIIELGCLVHDIGKIAIPDDVLLKPGRFDREDRKIMELHPVVGARLFSRRSLDSRIIEIILHHHERLDGSGYPLGLRGEEISLPVRIVSAADVFEALVARRPYKQPMSREKALVILNEDAQAGRMDRRAVEALAQVTEAWSPLEIDKEFTADYMYELEQFRRKTYFREPLSDYFNYRYLLQMDEARLLNRGEDHYHVIIIDFRHLREFNRRFGYVKADHILDTIGKRLHQTVVGISEHAGHLDPVVMLFRKGADFLIFSRCEDQLMTRMCDQLTTQLHEVEQEWGLAARFINRDFPSNQATAESITALFDSETDAHAS